MTSELKPYAYAYIGKDGQLDGVSFGIHSLTEGDLKAGYSQIPLYTRAVPDVPELDLSILEKLSDKADEFDIPDDFGPWPDIQDAMITVGDLRKVRQFLQDFRKVRQFLQDFHNMPSRTLKGQKHDKN